MSDIKLTISQAFLNELTEASKILMQTYKLGNTDLIKSIEWKYKDDIFILIANDYFQSVGTGRRPRARKVPVEDLIKWMKKKNIVPYRGQTYNRAAFKIQGSIYREGIKAKKFIDPLINQSLDLMSEYIAETLSVAIADELQKDLTFEINIK